MSERHLNASAPRLLGEDGLWVIISGDLMLFSIFFITFLFYRNQAVQIFVDGHMRLNVGLGGLNTTLLITSSWLVALANQDLRLGGRQAARLIAGSFLLGVCFCIVKAIEYGTDIWRGLTLNTSMFFTFYYMYTGIHLVHVLIGLVVLVMMYRRCRSAEKVSSYIRFIEGGGVFWHLVDVLWIIIFTLFYLVV